MTEGLEQSRDRFWSLPAPARRYIGVLVVLGAAGLAAAAVSVPGPEFQLSLLLVLVGLCAAGNAFEIFAPGHYSLQPNFAFLFWGALLLPHWAIALLAVSCFAPTVVTRTSPPYKVVFNVTNYLVTGLLVSVVTAGIGELTEPATLDGAAIAVIVAAAAVAALVNHAMIVVAIALAGEQRLRGTLHQLVEGLPLSLGVGLTGAVLALLWQVAPVLVLLAAGPVALVYRALWVPMLRHQAATDPKTGLFNYEHFTEQFSSILREAQRRHRVLSVVMVDLDHLRAINTRCGHLAGDRAIRAVADVLGAVAAEHGLAARFGGEEFCLLLPGFSTGEADALMEEVRRRVAAVEFRETDAPEMRVTFSAGIAGYPEHGSTPTDLLATADAALYEAKAAGRDRVRVALSQRARTALEQPDALPAPAPVAHGDAGRWASTADVEAEPAAPAAELLPEVPSRPAAAHPARLVSRYAALVTLAAILVGVAGGAERVLERPAAFAVLGLSLVLLDFVRIDMFGRGHISPGAVPGILLAWTCGPFGVLAAELTTAVVRLARREPLSRAAIDFGHLTLTGAAVAALFAVVPAESDAAIVALGAGAGAVYYAANALCLAAIWTISERTHPLAAWRERFAWAAPHYLFFGALAGAFMLTDRGLGLPAASVLVGLPILALWMAQKQYLDRSRDGVDRLHRANQELEFSNRRLRGLLEDNQELLSRMQRTYLTTITSLARTIEAKDPYTGDHTERVARIATMLAAQLGFDDAELRSVEMGAVLHDIGKIGVSDAVLLKTGRLDPEEEAQMRRHPEIASYIVADLELPPIVKQMVRNHHERFDGGGYPDGLAGEEIPLAARILAVADALDAMLSDRPYRRALAVGAAHAEIAAGAGTQFCPRVVDALAACLQRSSTRTFVQGPSSLATPGR